MTRRRITQRLIIGISFLFFSIVLVINNSTQLIQTFNIPLTKSLITWISIIAVLSSAIWAIVLASIGEFS